MEIKVNQLPKAIQDGLDPNPIKVEVLNATGPEKEKYKVWYSKRIFQTWTHHTNVGWKPWWSMLP